VETINPRTLIATFNRNPAVTVISCYNPTNASNVHDREEFYTELAELTKAVPKHNVLVVGGDMNGRIDANDATGSVYNKKTNKNGQLLLDYVSECNLKPLNTSFKKRNGKLLTHTSPSGAKSRIDYVLIDKKWKTAL
jgi:exonuclease III